MGQSSFWFRVSLEVALPEGLAGAGGPSFTVTHSHVASWCWLLASLLSPSAQGAPIEHLENLYSVVATWLILDVLMRWSGVKQL